MFSTQELVVLDGNEPMQSYQGGVGWGAGVIGKPLSFCLFKLFILTPDVPTYNIRS